MTITAFTNTIPKAKSCFVGDRMMEFSGSLFSVVTSRWVHAMDKFCERENEAHVSVSSAEDSEKCPCVGHLGKVWVIFSLR